MQFSDIIGQEEVKTRLLNDIEHDRMPHALMLCGPRGAGKLPLALALAQRLLCEEGQGCGRCKSCKMVEALSHPDLHFSFPVIKKKNSSTAPVSDDYLKDWREQLLRNAYFDINDWLEDINAENQQATYYVGESDALLKKLAIKSSQGGRRVILVWLPERMNQETANKLLKLIEEPPSLTHFILLCEEPDKVLGTILSRTQQVEMFRLSDTEVAEALESRNGLDASTARQVARIAGGSYLAALRYIQIDNATDEFFEQFVALMRMAYARDVMGLQRWTDQISAWNRERQKMFLGYAQNMIRENFVYNFRRPEFNYMNDREAAFALKFAKFINERNVVGFMEELGHVQKDIEQNVNARTVFFDAALRITILLRK